MTPRPPVVVDNSLMSDMICDTRAVLRHVHGYTSREERAALNAGSAFHLAVAGYFETGSARIARSTFEAAYAAWATANVPVGDRLAWPNVDRIFGEWLARNPLDGLPFDILRLGGEPAVEIGFALPLEEDVTVVGRLDALGVYRHDGTVVVIENKSTAYISEWWLGDFRHTSQLSGYIAGAIAHLGDRQVAGAYVNAIEFGRLPDSDRKCKTHGLPFAECGVHHIKFQWLPVERTPQALADWRFTAVGLARRFAWLRQAYPDLADIGRVPQQGRFWRACGGCPFKDWCGADRELSLVDSMLVVDKWEPYAHSLTGQTSTRSV